MRTLVNILAVLGAVLAVFAVGSLYYGQATDAFSDGRGMASLAFQLYGAIGAGAALLFGFVGRLMDRRVPRPARPISNICIAVGLIAGLLLFAAPMVFG